MGGHCRDLAAGIVTLTKLRGYRNALEAGATSLYLFGSTARDEANAGSDLDLFIDYDPNGGFSAFELAGIELCLEKELRVDVDFTARDSLHPLLREDIERSTERVF